jgi:hypothetical protein
VQSGFFWSSAIRNSATSVELFSLSGRRLRDAGMFGYLVVVGLLLGGGYGALNWLAAPEPAKVVSKVAHKPSSRSHYPEISDVKSPESISTAITAQSNSAGPSGNEKSGSDDRPAPASAQADTAAKEQGTPASVSAPAPDPAIPSPNVQVSRLRATGAREEVSDGVSVTKAKAPSTEARKPTRKMTSRDHRHDPHDDDVEQDDRHSPEQRQSFAGHQYAGAATKGERDKATKSERDNPTGRPLAVMTLRTIEFPDGRRVSQLLPYGRSPHRINPYPGGDRIPELDLDE